MIEVFRRRGRSHFPQKDSRIWRAKQTETTIPDAGETSTPQRSSATEGNNNNTSRGLPGIHIPTTEDVMEDLHEATLQYLSCSDPSEVAARRHLLLSGDAKGQMEETAAGVVAAAVKASMQYQPAILELPAKQTPPTNNPILLLQSAEDIHRQALNNSEQDETPTIPLQLKKRGRPQKLKSVVTTPDILRGVSSKKRNLSMIQRSPLRTSSQSREHRQSTSTRARTSGNGQTSTSANPPPIQLIPAMSKKRKDFHNPPPPAP